MNEAAKDRQSQDLQIAPKRPAFNVFEIVFDALFQRSVAAPAVDLRPACHSCLDFVTKHVFRNGFSELLDQQRSLGSGADEAHLAT